MTPHRRRSLVRLTASAVLIPVLAVVIFGVRDKAAVTHRRAKADALRRDAGELRTKDLGAVLRDFGHPESIAFEPAFPAAGAKHHAARLTLYYEYKFRALPWSAAQKVFLRIDVDMPSGRVDSVSVDETY